MTCGISFDTLLLKLINRGSDSLSKYEISETLIGEAFFYIPLLSDLTVGELEAGA